MEIDHEIEIDPMAVVIASETSVNTVLTFCRRETLPICYHMQLLLDIISDIKPKLGNI